MAALDAERFLEDNATWLEQIIIKGGEIMTTKNYHELIKDRIYIGGADDVKDMMENEKADVVFDLRAEAPEVDYVRVHSPIVDARRID